MSCRSSSVGNSTRDGSALRQIAKMRIDSKIKIHSKMTMTLFVELDDVVGRKKHKLSTNRHAVIKY